MRKPGLTLAAASLLIPLLAACETAEDAAGGVASAGETVVDTAGDAGAAVAEGVGQGIPSLVNVNLENVLNDLSLDLDIDRANIPINAQIPITLAANVCGVSINILSVSTGGQANCTATTTSPELAQVVQQQMAAGGSVGGGAQGGSTAGTSGSTATSGSSTAGATGTMTQSTGSTQGTAPADTTTQTGTGTGTTTETSPPQQSVEPAQPTVSPDPTAADPPQ